MSIHVCIASDHLAPNLLFHRQCPSDQTVILQTPAMAAVAKRLAGVFKSEQHPCTVLPIANDDPQQWEQCLLDNASEWEHTEVRFNATGGTKLMALVAHSTLRAIQDQLLVVYVDTANGRIHQLGTAGTRSQTLTARLSAKEHLRLYDLFLRASEDKEQEQTLLRVGESMAEACQHRKFQDWLGQLNWATAEAMRKYDRGDRRETQLAFSPGAVHGAPPSVAAAVVKQLTEGHIAAWSPDNRTVSLLAADEDQRHADLRWLNGGWIEQWAGAVLRRAQLDEVEVSARLDHGPPNTDGQPQVRNEIDVLGYHNNRMLLLECKTSATNDGDRQKNILYKLDSLRALAGGPLGQGVLVSARDMSAADLARAASEHIKVFHGARLGELEAFVRAWKAPLVPA